METNVILIDTSDMDTETAMERVKVAGNPVMENVLVIGLHVEIVASIISTFKIIIYCFV